MIRTWRLILLFSLLCLAAVAMARQDPDPVRREIQDFLRVQVRALPGQASYSIGVIERANQLPPCPALEAFLPPGARLWGRTSVGVRCLAEGGWTIYVPVDVKVAGSYLVAARALAPGQIVGAQDVVTRSGDLAELPAGVLTDQNQALGQSVAGSIAAGRPLHAHMLRLPLVVQQGQTVKLVSRGAGFSVSNEGRALNNAAAGQVAQIRAASGSTISGIARAGGYVEVTY